MIDSWKTRLIAIACGLAFSVTPAFAELLLTPEEISKALSHGPWPPEPAKDPSNRASGDARAISLGKALFNDASLSDDGTMSCATCHQEALDFTDARPRAMGRIRLDRNTQSLWNMTGHRWFGWSGDTDNLWAQSLTPILNPDEMNLTPETAQMALAQSEHVAPFEAIFGPLSSQTPLETTANIGKAIAAYVETLQSGKTSFDHFRDALASGDLDKAATYPKAAQRGLKLFVGEARCSFCHSGPAFTNGEFHDAGVPYFLEQGKVDAGRSAGLDAIKNSPFTLDGAYSDDPAKTGAWAVRNVRFQHSDFGIFRVPTLRRVLFTHPYMHDGSLPDIDAVLDHYNTINEERLHADGEAILRPLNLPASDLNDLKAFLQTLSDDRD